MFRTKHNEVHINDTSSYIDLAPLYGSSEEALDKIRARDGRGQLLPDTFAEDRLLLLPPAVCVLLVLFSRNHTVSSTVITPQTRWLTAFPVYRQEAARDQRARNVYRPRLHSSQRHLSPCPASEAR